MQGGRLVALPTGYRVGRYTLSAVLGEGGFGITYRARDEALRRDVAIKEYLPADVAVRENDTTIRPRSASDTQLYHWGLQRFVDEARTLAAMSAPNIVAVHDFMETNGTGYMVMELIEGRSLALILDRDGALPADRLMPITRQLLGGLEAVHGRGYLHRDIKPGNILIRPNGQPVLVDFGAARISKRSGTHAMTSVYTPGYAPAEQYAADGEQGPWTDIYALAATLYEAITGWPPPDATTRLLNDRMVPASQAAEGKYPASFLAGIDAGLGLRKEDRPQSVGVWRALLFDEPMPADTTISATRTDFPTVIAGQRSSKSGALATPPSIGQAAAAASQRQPSMREQSPSRLFPRDGASAKRAWWPVVAGALAILLLGAGGGLLFAGGLGLFDGSGQRQKEADRRAAAEDESRRQADLAAEAARRRAEEEAAKTKAAADEAERRRIEEAAARQRAADEAARAAEEARRRAAEEEAARTRAAEEEARRRAAAEEAQRRTADEARRRADDEARARAAAEEARRRADEEAARTRAAEEARRRAAEEEARRKAADDPQRRAQEEARRKAEEEAARARAAEEARRRAAAEEERRRREEAARKPPPSLHAGDGRWTATATVQTHARGRVCMDSFTITGTATNGVLQASTTYGGPMVIRIGDDGLKAVDIGYNGRPVRTYWGNMRSTLLEFVDGCIYRINWTKQ